MLDAELSDEAVYSLLPMRPRDFLILFALVDGERHGYRVITAETGAEGRSQDHADSEEENRSEAKDSGTGREVTQKETGHVCN